jgi:hypothetical protein
MVQPAGSGRVTWTLKPLRRDVDPPGMRTRLVPLLAAAAVVALSGATAAPARAVPADWAGVNAQFLFPVLPMSSWGPHAGALHSVGVKVARLDADWRLIEPKAPVNGVHTYDWAGYDEMVATLARRGIRWYPVVAYSATWSGTIPGAWRSPPASIDAYAEYARALVKRYGRGGTFWAGRPELSYHPVTEWQIWNEQNGSYFWPSTPDPARYADLYAAARTQIKSVDANARVVVGGLIARDGFAFLKGMLDARPSLQLDAVGVHAYAVHASGTLQWMRSARDWLRTLGRPDVPIEVTEYGWTTAGTINLASDAQRAQWIKDVMNGAAAIPGIDRLILHTWVSRETDPLNGEHWYGIMHPNLTPTLSLTAFTDALAAVVAPIVAPTATATATATATTTTTATAPTTSTTTTTSPAPTTTTTTAPTSTTTTTTTKAKKRTMRHRPKTRCVTRRKRGRKIRVCRAIKRQRAKF